MRKVYFDYNATTPVRPEVKEAMQPFLTDYFGNPSSLHWAGREVRPYYHKAKGQVADLINANVDEIIFTGSGTEGDNHAIKGVAYTLREKGRHIITSAIEHPAVVNTCRYLEKRGYRITYCRVDRDGIVDPGDVKRAIERDTILITIMYANNETGTIQPIGEIARIAQESGVICHSDMVQALGKCPIDIKGLGLDMASFSGHKLYAPKGVGALYIRAGLDIEPFIHGGHQEQGKRAGTENMPGIVAFGTTCELAREEMAKVNGRIEALRKRLLDGIMASIEGVRLNGHPLKRLPNTLNLSFEFIEGESLLLGLDMHGIAVSSGSACSSGSDEPSHVLVAMGIPHRLSQSAIRISLGRETTEEDVDYAISVIPGVVKELREISPFYKG